jgi:queuine tRNA-ribosyltransferase
MGYQLFDSALPTRDARAGRLYAFSADPSASGFRLAGRWFETIYVADKKFIKATTPIAPGCDCHTCRHYTLGYLHHLHRAGESLYLRLATIHNLRFMTRLMEMLRAEGAGQEAPLASG